MKLIQQGYEPKEWIGLCRNPEFDTQTQEICMNIAAGVSIRETLSFEDTAILPSAINNFPQNLRTVAILGALEGYMGYFFDNKPKKWEPFCASFKNTDDTNYCVSVFKRAIDNGEAPWMERTDIR
jgi:hypothetical protein